MSTVRRALVLSFAQRYGELGLRMVSMIVVARLLTPEDVGVYAVAAAVVGLASVFADFGLQSFLIKEAELPAAVERAALGFALTIGWSLAAFVFAVSWVLAERNLIDPTLAELLAILALAMLLHPLRRPFFAILQRDMMFDALFVVGIAKTTTLVITVIALAWAGFGASSLAWGCVAEALAAVIVVAGWRRAAPRIWPSLRGWQPILRFGSVSTAISALKEMGDVAPSLAIGHLIGFSGAGLFNRAQAVVGLFDKGVLQAVSPVILPMLAARQRDGRDLKTVYETKIAYLSGVAWPFFAFIALMADPIIGVLLGDQWLSAAPVIRILAVAGLLLPFNNMNLKFFIALEMQSLYLRLQAITQISKTVLVVGLCFTGSLEMVALAILVERFLKFALTYPPLKQRLGYDGPGLLSTLRSSVLITIAACAAPAAVVSTMGLRPDDSLLALAIAVIGAAISWFVGVFLCDHPLRTEIIRGAGRLRARLQPAG